MGRTLVVHLLTVPAPGTDEARARQPPGPRSFSIGRVAENIRIADCGVPPMHPGQLERMRKVRQFFGFREFRPADV